MASLRSEAVDRCPVSFGGVNGLEPCARTDDPFNIYSDPSWKPLLDLAREETDRIGETHIPFRDQPIDFMEELFAVDVTCDDNGSRHTQRSVRVGNRILKSHERRDPDIHTTWLLEPLLKDVDDLKAWLSLPSSNPYGDPDLSPALEIEEKLGDSGIVMIGVPDPLSWVAYQFDMSDYLIIAMTEPELFHAALEKTAAWMLPRVELVAKALPGRLWRIHGPEYASPPYLPPRLFEEYVVRYDTPMVRAIQKYGGYARIHSHGKLKDLLDHIHAMGCDGLDPIEPPPQGDVTLAYVRERYGKELTLFGNLEISDIETLPTEQFAAKVETAIREGTAGEGRGFVLMPSDKPYGRKLAGLTLQNYEKLIEIVTHQ